MKHVSNQSLSKDKAKPIFLVGFMGSGKTYWGKMLAAANNFSFIDLDEAIEKKTGRTVAEIFENIGEEYFRMIETKKLRSLVKKRNTIIACGGGTPCFYENMQWMNDHGKTIYLSSTPEDILKRVLSEMEKRPLIKNLNQAELYFFIQQKLREREPFYNQSKFIVQSNEASIHSFASIISNVNL